MKAKIGLLGCGNPARNWYMPTLSELTKHGEVEWVALCDMDEQLATEYGTKYGVPYYLSLDEMLDKHKDLTAVCIVTSDPLHHTLATQVAERGVSIRVTEAAHAWMADNGYKPEFGAREMGRIIHSHVKRPLADMMLFGDLQGGGQAVIDVQDDALVVTAEPESVPEAPAEPELVDA